MKVTVDIDCTPEEARAFFGLPDVRPLHAAWTDRMKGLIDNGVTPSDVERMMRSWTDGVPGMQDAFARWQQMMFSALGATAGGATTGGAGTGSAPPGAPPRD
jgi:hypothetical protein